MGPLKVTPLLLMVSVRLPLSVPEPEKARAEVPEKIVLPARVSVLLKLRAPVEDWSVTVPSESGPVPKALSAATEMVPALSVVAPL